MGHRPLALAAEPFQAVDPPVHGIEAPGQAPHLGRSLFGHRVGEVAGEGSDRLAHPFDGAADDSGAHPGRGGREPEGGQSGQKEGAVDLLPEGHVPGLEHPSHAHRADFHLTEGPRQGPGQSLSFHPSQAGGPHRAPAAQRAPGSAPQA